MHRLSQRGTRHACLSIVFVPVPRGTDRVTRPTSKTVAVRATSNELLLVHRPSSFLVSSLLSRGPRHSRMTRANQKVA